jgi:hypothetical protein
MNYQEVCMIRSRFCFYVITIFNLVLFLLTQERVKAAFDSDITDTLHVMDSGQNIEI